MNSFWQSRRARAFTLVELLVVIAIIGVLAALLLPTLVRAKQRALRVECINNLKQVGTAFQIFAHDHQSKFPMQVPAADGGSQEYTTAAETMGGSGFYFSWRHFMPLANELANPNLLHCPADLARGPAESFRTFQNSNLSFAVAVTADYNEPGSVLGADRNMTNNGIQLPSTALANQDMTWTRELHFFKGNALFADTHVEQLNTIHISMPANTVLFLPTVPATTFASGSAPSDPTAQPPPQPVSGTSSSAGPPSQSSHSATASISRANPGLQNPSPQMPKSFVSGMVSQRAANDQPSSQTSPFVENSAKENTRGTATNVVANPLAAPPVEDYQLPLARLFGAAKPDGSKSHWWLWLLLALLLAAAAYVYSRWKKYTAEEHSSEDEY